MASLEEIQKQKAEAEAKKATPTPAPTPSILERLQKEKAEAEARKAAPTPEPTPEPVKEKSISELLVEHPKPHQRAKAPKAAPPPVATIKLMHICTDDENTTSSCIPDSFLSAQRKEWEKEYEAEHACTVVFSPNEPEKDKLQFSVFVPIALFFLVFFLYRLDARYKEKRQ